MDKSKKKPVTSEDETMIHAHQNYQLLKQEVEQWQQERSSYWVEKLSLAENPPYMPMLDLPLEAIIELWQRLNAVAKVNLSDSELAEMWGQFITGQNEMDNEMTSRLQMALSGVACLASEEVKKTGRVGQYDSHDSLVCPVCGEIASMAILTPPNGKRMMHCLVCGFEWAVKRVGCLHCGSEDAKQQIYLQNETYPSVEMVVCQLCGQYFKEIDARQLAAQDYVWEELRTLPMNFAAERWLAEYSQKNNQIH